MATGWNKEQKGAALTPEAIAISARYIAACPDVASQRPQLGLQSPITANRREQGTNH